MLEAVKRTSTHHETVVYQKLFANLAVSSALCTDVIFNNNSPKAKWMLSNNPRDENGKNYEKKPVPLFYLCWLHPQLSSLSQNDWVALVWGKTDFGQSIWLTGGQTIVFTILNCLEYEFLKGFLVQERQHSFWKFCILSNILDLQWCRPNKWKIHSQLSAMFTCRDGRGGKLSSQASKML